MVHRGMRIMIWRQRAYTRQWDGNGIEAHGEGVVMGLVQMVIIVV